MEIDNQFPERVTKVYEKDFLNIYFFNINISLTTHDPSLNFFICIDNITGEETLSQIFDIGPGRFFCCFFIKC